MNEAFARFARGVADQCGRPYAFGTAAVFVVVWIIAGFFYGFTNQLYQLWINTITTIITFLMVFLLQNSQNRDAIAIQTKLDALIKVSDASNDLLRLERREESEINRAREEI